MRGSNVAKPTGKKPSAAKAVRAGPSNRKKTTIVAKGKTRPAGKSSAKAIERPVLKSSAKLSASAKFPDPKRMDAAAAKSSPEKSMPEKAASEKSVPAKGSQVRPLAPKAVASSASASSAMQSGSKPASAASPAVRPAVAKVASRPAEAAPATPAPAADNGKPRKPNSGFSARELDNFRDLLMAKRRELIGDMSSMEREALRGANNTNLSNLPIHMADMGTDNYEQEFTLGLVEKDRNLLREINHALAKIQNGTYGICEGTGNPIGKPRLEAQPWARFSIEYARQVEKNGMGVRTL